MSTTTERPPATPAIVVPNEYRRYSGSGEGSGQKASVWIYLLVIICVAIFGVPFVWIVLTALASPQQLAEGAGALVNVTDPQWSNFVQAFTKIDFLAYAGNSLFLSLLTCALTTASSATVGFAFSRFRAPGKKVLFNIVLATMMIPSIATLIPTYVLFARLGLVGTYWPWVLWGISGTPYLIFLFRQFFSAIPMELEDAAIIDGAGWLRMYLRVFLPLAKPALLTSALLSFTWAWGDYLAPSLLLNVNNTTLAVATANGYVDPHGSGIPTLQAAAAIMYLLPVIVIFLFTQKQFMGSSLGSSLKG